MKPEINVEVYVALVQKDQRFLLVQRNEPELPAVHGKWEFPGGKVHAAEDPRDAVVREVWEEAGVKIQVNGELPESYVNVWEYPGHIQTVLVRCFLGEVASAETVVAQEEAKRASDHRVSDKGWFQEAELRELSLLPGILFFLDTYAGNQDSLADN